jgi:hypothetical protein
MEKHHDLLHEFPAHANKIHELKTTNNHFRKLFDEYHETDHAIHRIETNTTPASDDYLNELRSKRVYLKDQLFKFLN